MIRTILKLADKVIRNIGLVVRFVLVTLLFVKLFFNVKHIKKIASINHFC
jgi:hypothetical protein